MATNLIDLIDKVNADDLPTNEFTIDDKDPMVILGKLNEVIAYLQTLQATINASDSKANEALQKAIQAVANATQALANSADAISTANSALSASNTALSTANTAISTANTALSSANSAVETAESAKTKAEGIDAKATTALSNSQTAVSTANTAETKAQEALDQVVAGQGTKVYRDTQLLTSLDIKPIEDNIAENTTAITALQNSKVDKVAGKQLSTEDFTTDEKNKLAGLNNYNDTQVKADITALQNSKVDKVAGKQLSTEDFTTDEKNKLAGLNNYTGSWQLQEDRLVTSAIQNVDFTIDLTKYDYRIEMIISAPYNGNFVGSLRNSSGVAFSLATTWVANTVGNGNTWGTYPAMSANNEILLADTNTNDTSNTHSIVLEMSMFPSVNRLSYHVDSAIMNGNFHEIKEIYGIMDTSTAPVMLRLRASSSTGVTGEFKIYKRSRS